MRLDRFLERHPEVEGREVRKLIAAQRIRVDGEVAVDHRHPVGKFSEVSLDENPLQERRAFYFMLNKPVGVVSAITDAEHQTVLDLMVDHPCPEPLHLAGRLDRGTTGLVLLTNDGQWSRKISQPASKIPKVYHLTTEEVIAPEDVEAFQTGFHFEYEDRWTSPAELEILAEKEARLTIHEGIYHQVKRMFHRVGNRVTSLHRERVGSIVLDPKLAPSKWRALTDDEIDFA